MSTGTLVEVLDDAALCVCGHRQSEHEDSLTCASACAVCHVAGRCEGFTRPTTVRERWIAGWIAWCAWDEQPRDCVSRAGWRAAAYQNDCGGGPRPVPADAAAAVVGWASTRRGR